MSQESRTRIRSAMLGWMLKSLVLASALVCASALPPAGRAGAPRPDGGLNATAPLRHSGVGVIAFEAGGEIYVVGAGGGAPTKIVENTGGVVNMQPALSPDASRVAFSSKRDGKFSIYVVGVDGTGLRRLTHGNGDDSEPAWSPDGSRIAFVRGFDATGSGIVIMTCVRAGDILVISSDEDANVQRPFEVNLTTDLGGTDPAWSPDGSRIAFASNRAGRNYDIYTMSSANGQDVLRLTGDDDDTSKADPSWSPDGNWIAYTGKLYEEWGGTQCGNMPIIGNPTGGGNKDCEKDNTCDEHADSFTSVGGPYIYVMTADGSQQKSLTETDGAAEPHWSPDGSQIVFVGGRKGEDVDVYTIAWGFNGIAPWVHLTSDSLEESSPSWAGSPLR